MNALLRALKVLVPRVSVDRLDLLAAARDLWPRQTLALARGVPVDLPLAVCWPETHAQVCDLLAWAARQGIPVVPYGGGSGVCGGASAGGGALVVDTKRMRHLGPVDDELLRVVVEPGLIGQELEDSLGRSGYLTRHSPSSIWCSTVGGWAAVRSAGQFSSLYGKFEDMVLAMRVATPGGTILTGLDTPPGQEDLGPMIMGSEGTLGIITRLSVRVVPRPKTRWMRGYIFPGLSAALDAMRNLMQAETWPAVLRLYDPVDSRIGGRLGGKKKGQSQGRSHGSLLHRLMRALDEQDTIRHHEFSLPLAHPALLNRVARYMGKRVVLIVGWEGDPDIVRAQVEAARSILASGEDMGAAMGERWYTHRHDVSYTMSPIFSRGAFADTMEVASTWARLEPMYWAVRAALGRSSLVMAHFSHAYPEGCSIYFSFMGRGDLDTYDRTWRAGLDAVRDAGGTVTHHHGVGVLKVDAATREIGHARRVYERRKHRLDPGNILNPGRVFGGAPPVGRGPEPPAGPGPVYSLDSQSLLARVDPHADPRVLGQALDRMGMQMRCPPDRPLAQWLRAYRSYAFARHEVALFGVQARFEDGCSARIGVAPRSAAGPDLRWGLLADAQPEWVEVPLASNRASGRALEIHGAPPAELERRLLRRGLRPRVRWSGGTDLRFVLTGGAAADLADRLTADGARVIDEIPPPVRPDGALIVHPSHAAEGGGDA